MQKKPLIMRLEDGFLGAVGVGRITECPLVISQSFGEGFTAVAGSCNVVIDGKSSQWMICNDDGVGNWTIVAGAQDLWNSESNLTRFHAGELRRRMSRGSQSD
jgi:hypothetical protein